MTSASDCPARAARIQAALGDGSREAGDILCLSSGELQSTQLGDTRLSQALGLQAVDEVGTKPMRAAKGLGQATPGRCRPAQVDLLCTDRTHDARKRIGIQHWSDPRVAHLQPGNHRIGDDELRQRRCSSDEHVLYHLLHRPGVGSILDAHRQRWRF